MELTVENALSQIPEKNLGYIQLTVIGDNNKAEMKTIAGITNTELMEYMKKQCLAYYYIGEYYYIIVKE